VELTGGSSTEYRASGGAVTLYTPGLATQLDVGVLNGRLVMGASSNFDFRGWSTHLGDEPASLIAGDLSLSVPVRGLVATKRKGDTTVTVFTGLVGQSYAAPFFYAQRATQFGAGFATSSKFRGVEVSTAAAIVAGRRTYLESLRKRWNHFQASETAGSLDSRFYFIGSGSFQSQHFTSSLNHTDYIWAGQHTDVNNELVMANGGGLSGFASFFQSKTVDGSALGGSWRHGPVQVGATEILSQQKSLLVTINEIMNQHFHVSQFISRSNGQTAFNVGGGYSGNLASVDVGYVQMFFPFATKAPFQKVLSVRITLQLPFHGTTVHLGTVAAPSGGTKWTAYAGSYVAAPWSQAVEVPGGPAQGHSIGAITYRGSARDGLGQPIAGVAVLVGKATVWTNEAGEFEVTTRKPETLPVRVMLDDSTMLGNWEVVSAPTSATPGTDIVITVRRK
jgi:hypothetical protein